MKTIGIFGGTFDPPHIGHYAIAEKVILTGLCDYVCWLPVKVHAFDKNPTAFKYRSEMVNLLIVNRNDMFVSEAELLVDNSQYTHNVLRYLAELYTGYNLRFIVGADQHKLIHKWNNFDEIRRIAPPIWVSRGTTVIPEPTIIIDISTSSTLIRNKIKLGEDVSNFIHEKVYTFIKENGLYLF